MRKMSVEGKTYLVGVVLLAVFVPLADRFVQNSWIVTSAVIVYLLVLRLIGNCLKQSKER
jgi:hypothetical protein